jgi:predicted O-linked N-acetylglucosamine transferase (SPINDLY family)
VVAETHSLSDDAPGWVSRGQAYIAAGNVGAAADCFGRATELEPREATHWARLGKARLSLRQYEAAHEALRHACEIEPSSPQWHSLLGYVLREQNDIEGSLEAYSRARHLDPDDLHSAVAEALLLPPIYRDSEDVRHWRLRFEEGLDRLRAAAAVRRSWDRQVLTLEWENFSLAYQGEDDRALQQGYADFVGGLLGRADPGLQARLPQPVASGRKIRVGFLSEELRRSTVGDYFSSWILGLPRDLFEVHCYFTGYAPDDLTARLAASCDRFQTLRGPLVPLAGAIRGDPPDLLIFPDVGMGAQSYLLANLRLAPIQCAAWGHPVTTGSRYIDHFLSCKEMEPEDAQRHYREHLLLLPGLGVQYKRPRQPKVGARARFGLPQSAHIYVCPNRLRKSLPSHDSVLIDILARDPEAVLLFFDTDAPGQRRAFVERLERGMSMRRIPPRQQLKFLPRLPHSEFRSALAVGDVMLDTPNFSGGSSALDALAAGLPIVAWEGRFMRGRQSAAMLRMVGVPELVAAGGGDYVDRALRVASDAEYRRSLTERIFAGLPRLFDSGEPVEALADALLKLVPK